MKKQVCRVCKGGYEKCSMIEYYNPSTGKTGEEKCGEMMEKEFLFIDGKDNGISQGQLKILKRNIKQFKIFHRIKPEESLYIFSNDGDKEDLWLFLETDLKENQMKVNHYDFSKRYIFEEKIQ